MSGRPADDAYQSGEKAARKAWPAIAAVLAAALIACAAVIAVLLQPAPEGDTGSQILPGDGMTREQAQAMVDEQTERSRITVSIAPKMRLASDGRLRVNFAVAEGNNGFPERLEVAQDGELVYASGVVEPGRIVEWTGAGTKAHLGPAVATVYAVDEATRADTGNPVSVEVEIVERTSGRS